MTLVQPVRAALKILSFTKFCYIQNVTVCNGQFVTCHTRSFLENIQHHSEFARGHSVAPQYLQQCASASCPSAPHAGHDCVVTFCCRVACASSTETIPVGTAMMP